MCKFMQKVLKRMDVMDIALIKVGSLMFGMFLASYLPGLMEYMWHFLGLAILAMLRPAYRGYLK